MNSRAYMRGAIAIAARRYLRYGAHGFVGTKYTCKQHGKDRMTAGRLIEKSFDRILDREKAGFKSFGPCLTDRCTAWVAVPIEQEKIGKARQSR